MDLRKLLKKMFKNNGFTLIEVVTVTAIIAITAAIGGPSITGFLKSGNTTSNSNIARAIFLASQNALTDLYNRGELQSYIKFDETKDFDAGNLNNGFAEYKILTTANKLPAEVSASDSDVNNDRYTYFMMLNNGEHTNPLYQLIDKYISDKGILQKNICIEFNAKTGIVKSAFYSDKITVFQYGGGGENDLLINRSTTDKIGYYGAKQTGTPPVGGKPVKVELIDGKPSNTSEIPNTLYIEAYVPNNEDTYTINLMASEDENGNILPFYTELTKDGKPFALSFKVNGTGAITTNNLFKAMISSYTDMKASEHAGGYNVSVFVSSEKFDPFGEGKSEYVKVTWVLDTMMSASMSTTHKTLISQMKNPLLIQAKLTSDNTGNNHTSTLKSSHFDSQTGTSKEPIQKFTITTARHLNNIRYKLNGTYSQTQDITIRDYSDKAIEITAIGSKTQPFTGTYTGVNKVGDTVGRYKIIGLSIKESKTPYVGLFAVNDGTIENIEIVSATIHGLTTKVKSATGVVTSYNTGTIRQVLVTNSEVAGDYGDIGIIAGINEDGIIENCAVMGTDKNYSNIIAPNAVNVGGLVGSNTVGSIVRYSIVTNTNVEGKTCVAGIAGRNSGEIHDVIYNYASEEKAQTDNFVVPIQGEKSSTSIIVGENITGGTINRAISTAMTKGINAKGTTVEYNPIVGTTPENSNINNCYYLTGVGYNEFISTKLGTAISPVELMSTAFVTANFGKTDKYEAWTTGPGTNTPTESFPYPVVMSNMPLAENWPLPSGASAITLSYYEKYSGVSEMGRWTPKESTLREDMDTYVIDEGYGIELYNKDKGDYIITLSSVSSKYSITLKEKICNLNYDIASSQWKINGSSINEENIIETTREINGIKIGYSILKINDTMLSDIVDKGYSYIGPNIVKVQITRKGSTENLVERSDEKNNIYLQTLFAKGIYEFNTDKLADSGMQASDFALIVRSPQHLQNINYMNDMLTGAGRQTNYLKFKQELNINLTTDPLSKKHKNMDTIQANMHRNGGMVTENLFTGIYDGNYKKIENMYINTLKNNVIVNVGLFSNVQHANAKIKNLTLEKPVIASKMRGVGGIVGTLIGDMENCKVTGGKIMGIHSVGGLVGESDPDSNIKNCTVESSEIGYYESTSPDVKPELDIKCVGGIVGYNYGAVENCRLVNSKVRGWEVQYYVVVDGVVGGIVGQNDGTIKDVEVSGTVEIGEKKYWEMPYQVNNIGGIAGYNSGIINGATIRGAIKIGGLDSPTLTQKVGGIAGTNEGDISNAYVIGNADTIKIEGDNSIGGLVGYNKDTLSKISTLGKDGPNLVLGSVHIGTSTITKQNVGGIVGKDEAKYANHSNLISRSAVVGTRTHNVKIGGDVIAMPSGYWEYITYIGGIIGNADGVRVQNCYFSAPGTMNSSPIKGINKMYETQRINISGMIAGNNSKNDWKNQNFENLYFASIAPKDEERYYPLFSADDKIPNGHAKAIKYFYNASGINGDSYDVVENNKKMAARYDDLRDFIGGNSSELPNTLWTYLPEAGINENVYPYPVLISEKGKFEGYMKTLVNGDWVR